MQGEGLLNKLIDNLPFELHLPGYNFCGPGTKLEKRLARGDKGINELDNACLAHDIAYTKYQDLENRHKADTELINMAKRRIKAKNSNKKEKLASWLVSKVMKSKLKSGAGMKIFRSVVSKIRSHINKLKPKSKKEAIATAYALAKKLFSQYKNLSSIPRVIPLPKTGGFLPLLPIFAGLSALGSIAGGAAGIAKAVNDSKSAQISLQESKRHNRAMEAIALGKGLYVKPYKKGNGLFINYSKN